MALDCPGCIPHMGRHMHGAAPRMQNECGAVVEYHRRVRHRKRGTCERPAAAVTSCCNTTAAVEVTSPPDVQQCAVLL